MTLHLTRDEADRLEADGRVVLFRAGERLVYVDSTAGTTGWRWRRLSSDGLWVATEDDLPSLDEFTDSTLRTLKTSPRTRPPAEFVEAAAPCETCGGDGIIVDGGGRIMNHQVSDRWMDCPDCLDGKRRVAVVVPCEQCERIRAVMLQHGLTRNDEPCDDCGQIDGLVTVGHVVVVTSGSCPVIHWDDQVQIATLDEFVVVGSPTDPTWAAHYVRGDDIGRRMGRFTLPPDVDPQSLVGQYAIGIKVVEP